MSHIEPNNHCPQCTLPPQHRCYLHPQAVLLTNKSEFANQALCRGAWAAEAGWVPFYHCTHLLFLQVSFLSGHPLPGVGKSTEQDSQGAGLNAGSGVDCSPVGIGLCSGK